MTHDPLINPQVGDVVQLRLGARGPTWERTVTARDGCYVHYSVNRNVTFGPIDVDEWAAEMKEHNCVVVHIA